MFKSLKTYLPSTIQQLRETKAKEPQGNGAGVISIKKELYLQSAIDYSVAFDYNVNGLYSGSYDGTKGIIVKVTEVATGTNTYTSAYLTGTGDNRFTFNFTASNTGAYRITIKAKRSTGTNHNFNNNKFFKVDNITVTHQQITNDLACTSYSDYRYGFQGQEVDNEIKGNGNSINYKYRMHDPRLGRFFAVDPLTPKYPQWGPYNFSGNRVIDAVELEGLEYELLNNGETTQNLDEADDARYVGYDYNGENYTPKEGMETVKTTYYKELLNSFDTFIVATKSIRKGNYYTGNIRDFFLYLEQIKVWDINQVDESIMRDYFGILATRKKQRGKGTLSESTVNCNLSTLRMFSMRMQASGVLKRGMPIPNNFRSPNTNNNLFALKRSILTTHQIKLIYERCQNNLERSLIALAYGCGLRRTALENLKDTDINFQKGLLTVIQSKNNKTRHVPISDFF